MRIPSKIKILGHWFKVKIVDIEDLDENEMACSWYARNLIKVAGGLPESRTAEAFMHEIFEMIMQSMGCEIDDKTAATIDHKVLTSISEIMFQVIRDNKLDFRKGSK